MSDRASVFRAGVEKIRPELSPGDAVLVEEACRLIRRSDRLEAALEEDELKSPALWAEARATAAELRQVVRQLNLAPVAAAVAEPVKSKVDEIAERRKKRRVG